MESKYGYTWEHNIHISTGSVGTSRPFRTSSVFALCTCCVYLAVLLITSFLKVKSVEEFGGAKCWYDMSTKKLLYDDCVPFQPNVHSVSNNTAEGPNKWTFLPFRLLPSFLPCSFLVSLALPFFLLLSSFLALSFFPAFLSSLTWLWFLCLLDF